MFSQASVILTTAGGWWPENIGGAGIVYFPYGFSRIYSEISRELKEQPCGGKNHHVVILAGNYSFVDEVHVF